MGDTAEQVSPVGEGVTEGHEEYYDLNCATDKAESAASEVRPSDPEVKLSDPEVRPSDPEVRPRDPTSHLTSHAAGV